MTTARTEQRQWHAGDELPPGQLRARNTSAVSENKIHEDEIARTYGFRGGLVPGATTYAYLASYLAEHLGEPWLTGGTATVALIRPVYDGDQLSLGARVLEAADAEGGLVLECWVDGPDGSRCAVASAGLPSATGEREPRPAFAHTDEPPRAADARRSIGVANAPLGATLPPVAMPAGPEAIQTYLNEIDASGAPFRTAAPPFVHPGWWPSLGNRVLSANFRLGPWMHTRSEIRHLAPAHPGGVYRAYGKIVEAYEKRGHEYVTADVLIADGNDQPVARLRHTAIVVIAPRE